ncbi:sensor histidine kinase [Microbacterium capsulatum]|uniref:histidine kinase n=1 Tax=Microbacterium capsulatum TaxID=3041921 RepID=A0ABU0XE34_9MICO|nr:sensor histidine kinase [Microbacterium sp. ASV81]MDQ4212445.1 sensor histidine kinase [Microbacterium sp. ASV81]
MGRSMSLSMQLLVLQVAIVLTVVLGTGVVVGFLEERAVRDAYQDRMIAVAQSVATLPSVIDAFGSADPSATIQPIAETVRKASNVTYVVVTDEQGIRLSHPNPDRIGQKVSTDPSVALSGSVYVGTEPGTLGLTWRVKVPIFDRSHTVIGVVSVGILEDRLQADFIGGLPTLGIALSVAAVVGVAGSAWIGRIIRRRIYGLEPDEIRAMLDTREAMLHGIREGIIAVDAGERLVVVNDAAARLLDVEPDDVIGRRATEVLDDELAGFLLSGETAETPVLSGERVLVVHGAAVRVDGQDVGRIAMIRDRTELEETLRDLQGAQSMAEDLRAHSHEFANTLQVIGGLLETGRVDAAVAFIERAGGGVALGADPVHQAVGDIELEALIMAKTARASEQGVDLVVDPASQLSGITDGLRDDLLTIVGTLLDNALEALGAHGGRILLSIRDDLTAGRIVVRVDDDGPGVPVDKRAAIFEPDVSDKAPTPGKARRGMGLTIVKRVARRLGGMASASASEWGGARFVVDLPRPAPVPRTQDGRR